MNGYLEVMTVGALALVVLAVLAVASAWGLSRLMDRANRHAVGQWEHVLSVIHSDAKACAVYYGARWVGICILVGWLFSKPV